MKGLIVGIFPSADPLLDYGTLGGSMFEIVEQGTGGREGPQLVAERYCRNAGLMPAM